MSALKSYIKWLLIFFALKKLKKPPSKVAQKNSNPLFFPCCPELPKWPKQKNSCSKLWPIDQLYIELGNCRLMGGITSRISFRHDVKIFKLATIYKMLHIQKLAYYRVSHSKEGKINWIW